MSLDDPNPYYNPETLNLFIVEETSEPDLSYEFHYVTLWEHKETGARYWAEDWGCSCPSPFENFNTLESLTPLAGHEQEYEDRKYACSKPREW